MHFTHLHTHSHYSLLDGLAKIDKLVARAKALEMEALALTDHGVMYGLVEFYQQCKAVGIKPILGMEIYIAPHGRFLKRAKIDEERYHLVLLAKNKTGYQNLIKLTTAAHLEGFYYKPRVDWELLSKNHEGLIALTACLRGEVPFLIKSGNFKKAEEQVQKYKNLFGENNFYLEVQHHPSLPEQKSVNQKIAELGQKFNIPLVATNDIHYLDPQDAEAHDVLLCLQTKKKKEDQNRMCMLGEDYSFRTPVQMIKDFQEWPEAITNTQKIVDECNLELNLGKVSLPHFEVPQGKNVLEYLKDLCLRGLSRRYGLEVENIDQRLREGDLYIKKIMERLEYELSVIAKTGFAPYFLIVQDFVNWAKDQGIIVGPGRGSVPGSLASYLLNITNLDPLKYGLLFERFLNPERITMPDIDLDFTDRRRDEVINYVSAKYGRDQVAQIITFGTMAARAAVRDVGRVLDFPYNYCDRLAKLIPMFASLDEALKINPELHLLYQRENDAQKIIEVAKKLEGVARHASTHACGVIITKDSLDKYVPLQYTSSGDRTIVSQYSLRAIEDLGLLKIDFLGLKNLTILEDTIEIIEKVEGVKIKIDEIPLNDRMTFQLLQKSQTTGVFQLESAGMKRYLKRLKPTTLEDIIAIVSLYRPGPMELIPDYIAAKHGKKTIQYLHPKLKPILEKTYGIIVYQEQILQITQDLAGFSLGEADILRKAVGKKIVKLLKEQKKKFIKGCLARGISKDTAEKIFEFIEPFARYGFNRAHGACYALIAYQTAYLKANFPQEFMAALLTSDQDDTERIAILVDECEEMGIRVLPPDLNESFSRFTVVKGEAKENGRIRFGLLAIKNVGEGVVKAIIQERKRNGPYQSLDDFLLRVKSKDLNKKSLESLIKCGALDQFGERSQLFSNIGKILNFIRLAQKESENGQTNLFGILVSPQSSMRLRLEEAEPASKKERLSWEKELLGLYVSEHPFKEFEPFLENVNLSLGSLKHYLGRTVKVAGVITKIQRIITRSGEPMLFVKLEDTTGSLELLVFPSLLKTTPTLWQEEAVIMASGKLSDKEGERKLIVQEVESLSLEKMQKKVPLSDFTKSRESIPTNLYITFPSLGDLKRIDELKALFSRFPGNYRVYLIINGSKTRKIETNFFIEYSRKIEKEIEKITGLNSIRVESIK